MSRLLPWLTQPHIRVSALNFWNRVSARSMYVGSIIFIGMLVIPASSAHAQATLEYLRMPPPVTGPFSSTSLTNGATYTLPGYGKVAVTWAATTPLSSLPYFNPVDAPLQYNQSAGGYTWGTDTQDIGIYNPNGTVSYSVTFAFMESDAPDLNRLVLVVAGLATDTGATVTPPSLSFLGESPFQAALPSSPTSFSLPNFIVSGHTNPSTDAYNTGWALFRMGALNPGTSPTLSVKFKHVKDDGIGVTLGYSEGLLKVCKVAGPGVAVGTPYTFTAGSTPFTVPAGPAPGGNCVVAPFRVGSTSTVTVAESVPLGNTVSSITVAPPGQLIGTPNLAGGSVDVAVASGVTEVTFTDRTPTGFLEICKNGAVSGTFQFWLLGGQGPFIVPAGACSPAIEVMAGPVAIYEQRWPPYQAISCSTIPPSQQGQCINLGSLSLSIVTVAPGDISTMTTAFITNKR